MKRGAIVLLLGLVLGAAGFFGFYYAGTAPSRDLLRGGQPELAWLKEEYHLSDAEYARIVELHAAYLPACAARCQHIEELTARLRQASLQATNVGPEIRGLLAARAAARAECEAEMMAHFLAVSRTMPAEQGRRYLEWVERQTFMGGRQMESAHGGAPAGEHAPHHPM